jgi:hypothetical protein
MTFHQNGGLEEPGDRITTKYCGRETFSFLLIKRQLKHPHIIVSSFHTWRGPMRHFKDKVKLLSIMPRRLELDAGEWSTSCPCSFTTVETAPVPII